MKKKLIKESLNEFVGGLRGPGAGNNNLSPQEAELIELNSLANSAFSRAGAGRNRNLIQFARPDGDQGSPVPLELQFAPLEIEADGLHFQTIANKEDLLNIAPPEDLEDIYGDSGENYYDLETEGDPWQAAILGGIETHQAFIDFMSENHRRGRRR